MSDYNPRYDKRWRHDRAQGIRRLTDAAPVADHIRRLNERGMTLRTIAAAAEVDFHAIRCILSGERRQTRTSTADRILAVQYHVPAFTDRPGVQPRVSATGTIRRLRALLALGWRYQDINSAGGCANARCLMRQGRWVEKATHDAVAKAYRELSGRQGPSSHTRTVALNRGYLSPAYWDDIDLDPEPELDNVHVLGRGREVDEVVVQRILDGDYSIAGDATKAERIEVVARWQALGRSLSSLEAATGWRPDRYRTPADVRRIIERSLAS